MVSKILQFPNHLICVVVTVTRVNRGAEFGLEIPLDYIFEEDSTVKTWIKKALEKVDNFKTVKVDKCKRREGCQIQTLENRAVYFSFATKNMGCAL